MRISLNEDCITYKLNSPRRPQKESLRLMRQAGFDTADFGLFGYTPETNLALVKDHIAAAHAMREYCDDIGIAINQSHVPFFENRPMPEGYRDILIRCVETSAILGARCVVVHADTWYERDYVQWDREKVLDAIYEVLAPVVDAAARCGVMIAMETLFEWCGTPEHRVRFCSYTDELEAITGRFDSDIVGVCWDFGHGRMAYGEKQFEMLKKLNRRIIATHVHDNNGKADLHSIPFAGSTDWYAAMEALAAVGYEGDLTFELHYLGLPDELAADFLKYARRTGIYLRDRFEEYKNARR